MRIGDPVNLPTKSLGDQWQAQHAKLANAQTQQFKIAAYTTNI
jgi:hypothetical protein